MIKKKSFIVISVVSLFGLLLAACTSVAQDPAPSTGTSSLGAAPLFDKTTVNGESFSLQKNIESEKPTVVYFMASSCTKCAKNWEALNEVYPEYEDKIDFVAVSVDPTDDNTVLSELAADKGFVFETVAGDAQLAVEYEVFKQTAKIAINSDGEITERHDGVFTPEEWRAFFDRLA